MRLFFGNSSGYFDLDDQVMQIVPGEFPFERFGNLLIITPMPGADTTKDENPAIPPLVKGGWRDFHINSRSRKVVPLVLPET